MPVAEDGTVHFTTTLFALIRECLIIKMGPGKNCESSEREIEGATERGEEEMLSGKKERGRAGRKRGGRNREGEEERERGRGGREIWGRKREGEEEKEGGEGERDEGRKRETEGEGLSGRRRIVR